jgi:succinate dehydrogenase/fumarate reductase flavoprotein subunit
MPLDSPQDPNDAADLVVIGGGVGGMTAALVGALEGLRVTLCEATEQLGGTSASSAGTIWIPGNSQGARAGLGDSAVRGKEYLDSILGETDERGLRRAFLASASEAVDYLEQRSEVRFVAPAEHPDYLELPGAALGGRALAPLEFDGRRLGREFERIRPPLPEFLVLGGMMVGKADIATLVGRYRSGANLFRTLWLVSRYALDRLRYSRGTRLVMGNALVARLYFSLLQAGVQVRFGARLERLEMEGNRVVGAVVQGAHQSTNARATSLRAKLGVVLATGGIGHNAELRSLTAPTNVELHSLAFEGDRGDGIIAARKVGGAIDHHTDSLLWQPVSITRRPGGTRGLFPHLFLDRAKPGLIAVNGQGQRFVNEGSSYHHFVESMLHANAVTPTVPAYLICDAQFVRNYGLGIIPPGTRRATRYVEEGYVHCAATLAALAQEIGIDGARLSGTVERNNDYARSGVDPEFGKGSTPVSRFNGDPAHRPNPCLGPIEVAPFYALAVWPADAASSTGLATDDQGCVLDAGGEPIPGLFACGNDMASMMRGSYPGPGATLGPALVFGYRIAKRAAASALAPQRIT